jgi:hypothetical protein
VCELEKIMLEVMGTTAILTVVEPLLTARSPAHPSSYSAESVTSILVLTHMPQHRRHLVVVGTVRLLRQQASCKAIHMRTHQRTNRAMRSLIKTLVVMLISNGEAKISSSNKAAGTRTNHRNRRRHHLVGSAVTGKGSGKR